MASAALSQAPPILDFSAIKSPDAGTRDQLISQIHAACQDKGFFQLTNTGISPALQKRILSASKQFFALPQAEKSRLDKKTNSYNRGYEDLGSQMLEAGTAPESKEGYYLGRDIPADSEEVKRGAFNTGPNLWPESLGEEFKDVCNEYFEEVYKIATTIIDVLALGLGLEPAYFEPFAKNGLGTLRFIHYPPTPMTSTKERGIGAHRDFGCITVLMQDEVGGLQVQNMATGEWIDVAPVPNAYVINLGNLMMRWSNHKYTSNMHRVINKSGTDRYSIPFFFSGNPEYVFDCIPGCEDEGFPEVPDGKKSKYNAISVRDYVGEQYVTSYGRAEKHKAEIASTGTTIGPVS